MTYKLDYPAFVGGEVSDMILGRTDQSVYFKALRKARDVYIFPQGPVVLREGLKRISQTAGNQDVEIVPFSFNTEQDYLLEFSPQRVRVFKDDVVVANYDNTDDADLAVLTADVIAGMGYTQDADTLIITHKDIQPLKITRTSDTAWTFDVLTIKNIPVFAYDGVTVTNPAATLTPSASTGEITLTAGSDIFSSSYEKQYIVVNRGLVFITEYVSATQLKGLVISDLSSTDAAASGDWEYEEGYEDVWSSSRGWAAYVNFFKGRMYFAGGARPQTAWASVVGDFFNFDPGEGDDADGFEFTLDDDGVNAIQSIFTGRTLQLFTTGGEFYIRGSTTRPVTPTNIVDLVEKASSHGAEPVTPAFIDGATVYVERDGAVIRDFIYNDVEQSYSSNSRSDLAEHLIKEPVSMAVRKSIVGHPYDNLYVVNSDGSLAVLNSKRQVEFDAWSSFTTEGIFRRAASLGKEVYFTTSREIDGATIKSIEKLSADSALDFCSEASSGSETTSWSGFAHLANQEVYVRGDNFNLGLVTVAADGTFTTGVAVSDVQVGFVFKPQVQPLPPDANIANKGSLTGEYRRIAYVNMRLKDTESVVVQCGNRTYTPSLRNFGENLLDKPLQKYSGWKKVFCDGISMEPEITITQDVPGAFTLLSMTMGVN